MNRRRFLRNSTTAALAPAVATAQPSAANGKIGIGVIGCGGMGRNDLADFQKQPDAEVRAVCDVFRPAADQARQMTGGRAGVYADFRRVLDRKDIDAVVIATPDHWHALMARGREGRLRREARLAQRARRPLDG